MAIKDFFRAAEDKMEQAARKRKFDQTNRAREEAVDLQAAQAKCRGDLEVSKRDFGRIIREQSKYIREGEIIGADTSIQEQMLFDAAVGYLLVRDAIYSLRSLNSHHTVSHAYSMLDLATRQMSGKKSGLPLRSIRNRNIYGYITSEAAYQLKCDIISGFYEELKDTGDIEACLEHAKKPGTREAELREHYTRDVQLPDRDPDPVEDDPNNAINRLRGSAPQKTEDVSFTFTGNPMTKTIDFDQNK